MLCYQYLPKRILSVFVYEGVFSGCSLCYCFSSDDVVSFLCFFLLTFFLPKYFPSQDVWKQDYRKISKKHIKKYYFPWKKQTKPVRCPTWGSMSTVERMMPDDPVWVQWGKTNKQTNKLSNKQVGLCLLIFWFGTPVLEFSANYMNNKL